MDKGGRGVPCPTWVIPTGEATQGMLQPDGGDVIGFSRLFEDNMVIHCLLQRLHLFLTVSNAST